MSEAQAAKYHAVESDRIRYIKAMIGGQANVCIQIEQMYDLFGYTPEMVLCALSAITEGRDVDAALSEYQREAE